MSTAALSSFRNVAAATLEGNDGTSLPTVFGHPPPPVLVGGLVALFLSGAVFMQVVMYFQVYQTDLRTTKCMVFIVWLLDILHSVMVCTANWANLIEDYGAFDTLDRIQWSISLTIALTAVTTLIVHCFFINRIYKMSHHNRYITGPLIALALLRVASAFVTTTQMLRLGSYVLFIDNYTYIFTLGLAISASLDILITGILCYYLQRGRPGFKRMNHTLDVLTLYTVENGMLTCIATALSLFFWLFMRSNFIFLGMHLAINKLYANSLLASLNARQSVANRVNGSGTRDRFPLPLMLSPPPQSPRNFSRGPIASNSPKPLQVTIDVQHTVQRDSSLDVPNNRASDSSKVELSSRGDSDTLTDAKDQ